MNGWIEWKGGECPVDDGYGFIMVRFRSGQETVVKSHVIGWNHNGSDWDIMAYKVED